MRDIQAGRGRSSMLRLSFQIPGETSWLMRHVGLRAPGFQCWLISSIMCADTILLLATSCCVRLRVLIQRSARPGHL